MLRPAHVSWYWYQQDMGRSYYLVYTSQNVVHFIVTCDELSRDVGHEVDCLTSPKSSLDLDIN